MAVGIPLEIEIGNNASVFTMKHLVINITRCFFVLCTLFICFNTGFILACGCEDNIVKYKKIYSKQSTILNTKEFGNNKLDNAKVIKPAIVIKPQVIYPEEYKSKKFAGAEKCKLCHSVEYRKWQKTKHAGAYADMKNHYEERKAENKKNNIEESDCESCHSTGYGYSFGFRKEFRQEKLVNIQCEVCHGPGEEHIRNYKQNKMAFGENPVPEILCRSCHCEEINPGFNYQEYLNKINCGQIKNNGGEK